MSKIYSYLTDPRAIAEIRKHKWLESQKAGKEIGFATAALDWINKYGPAWKEIHVKEARPEAIFRERRFFRRFKFKGRVELLKGSSSILSGEPLDISLEGILCKTNGYIIPGSPLNINLLSSPEAKSTLGCKGMVDRIKPLGKDEYELFIKFDSCCQEKLESWEYFRSN